jgi:hypothetical protein
MVIQAIAHGGYRETWRWRTDSSSSPARLVPRALEAVESMGLPRRSVRTDIRARQGRSRGRTLGRGGPGLTIGFMLSTLPAPAPRCWGKESTLDTRGSEAPGVSALGLTQAVGLRWLLGLPALSECSRTGIEHQPTSCGHTRRSISSARVTSSLWSIVSTRRSRISQLPSTITDSTSPAWPLCIKADTMEPR